MIPFRIKATANYESRRKQSESESLRLIAQSIHLLAEKVSEISESQNKIFGTLEYNSQQVKNQRFEQRFRRISIQIPKLPENISQNSEERKHLSEVWLGRLCQQVFSTTFFQYQQQNLDERKAKAYCTENILSSVIKMIKINNLDVQQISNIDNCLKDQLLPYFLIKYPMSEDAEVNLEFENKIIQVDSSQSNENDLIFKSGVEFNYRENGHYDRQIMRFLNFIIELPNSRFEDETLFKSFYSAMENLFKKVEDPEFTIAMNKFDIRDLQNQQKQKQILDNYEAKSKDNFTIQQEKEREHYKEKVKNYTKKLIGRKISENVKPFSEIQIQEGELKLKNPAIMRIITKWCEQLMLLFQTDRSILNKQEQFRMKDGKQKILKRKHLLLLAELLKRQKKKVDQYLDKVNRNNSSSQYDFGNRVLPKFMEKFSQDESQVGLFATSVIRNYQTYLVGYINTIIHSLMSAVKDYEEMVKAYEYKQQQYGEDIEKWRKGEINFADLVNKAYFYRLSSVPASYYSLIPQLVSFRVGDLMRCRCISKQKQIIALYTELQRISSIKNSGLKIVKIKNRLQKGTKDILINILFKNKMLAEMQLAIATNRSKFVDFSNKFNHVLYQLKRAQFGPISEMCNIWINNDVKSEFYVEKSIKTNVRKAIPNKQSKNKHVCSGDPLQFPFRCSQCQYFYNDCSYVLKHIQCNKQQCKKKVCSLCRAQRFDYNELKKHFVLPSRQVLGMEQGQKFLEYRKRTSTSGSKEFLEKQEKSGMLIDLKGENKKPIYYKHVKIGKRSIIVEIVDVNSQNMRVIKQITTFEQMRIFKKEYLIFSSPKITQIYTSVNEKAFNRVLTQYNFPKYIKKWYQKEKSSIAFMDGGIQDRDILNIDLKFTFTHKICFYENKITDLELLLSKFGRTEIVDVGHNFIKSVQFKMIKPLNLKVLYLNYNNISFIDSRFIDAIQDLEQLQLANNQLISLPSNFGKLSQLKIINLSRNLFKKLPDVVSELKSLRVLNLYSAKSKQEKILQIPESIGNLKILRKINLNFNALERFPEAFGELQSLEILYATNNKLKSLPQSFRKLQKLKILNLASNQFDSIPDQIGSLVNIEILNLQSCSKTEQPLKKVPQSYCNLVNIKMMDVSKNKVAVLPDNIGSLGKLQTLFLYENKLTILPESICDISSLRLLYVSNNLLKSLPKNIDKLENLEKLTLKQNYTMSELPENITKLKKLQYLIAKDNKFKYLPYAIGQLTQLRELIVSNNEIKSLPKSILKLKGLQRIQIDMNKLDDDSKVLLSTFVSIKNLKIDIL